MNAQRPQPRLPTCETAGSAERVERLLAGQPAARQIRHLCDTRALHRLLMRQATRRVAGVRAGAYRGPGEPVVVRLKVRADAPMVSRTCPPERVATEMRLLSLRIEALLRDPVRPEMRYRELAAILAAFFRIHPYIDGNGRVARIMVRRAAGLLNLPLNRRWTLDRAGYGPGMSLAIETYHLSPLPLESYLRRFLGPVADDRAA